MLRWQTPKSVGTRAGDVPLATLGRKSGYDLDNEFKLTSGPTNSLLRRTSK